MHNASSKYLTETSDSNDNTTSNPVTDNSMITPEMLNKPISEYCLKDMLRFCAEMNKPFAEKIDEIGKESKKIYPLQGQVKLLQMENNYKDEKNETLTSIIIGLQKKLNKIDGESRNCCVIITGVPEENMVSPLTSTVQLILADLNARISTPTIRRTQ